MKTNKNLQDDPQNRHLRAECEARMMEALGRNDADELAESAQERLAVLFALFPDLQKEYKEMQMTLGVIQSLSIPSQRSHDEWSALERRIVAHVGAEAPVDMAPPDSIPQRVSTIFALYPISLAVRRLAAIAAIFLGGIFLGRWSVSGEASGKQDRITLAEHSAAQNTALERRISSQGEAQETEAEHFLNDAHLLMLGVMSMNAECGVANPKTLVAQREQCIALMAQAQELRRTLSPEERMRLAHVIVQVEFALAELAGTQPAAVNASMIRKLQAHTDDALCEVSAALATTRSQ